jgi:hypothetical protein
MAYRSRMVVGEFEQVTRNFGSLVRLLNERFGTSFAEFEPSETNVGACLDLVRERATPILEWSTVLGRFESGLITRSDLRGAQVRFAHRPEYADSKDVWMPSPERAQLKDQLRKQWFDPSLTALRMRAHSVYKTFIAGTDPGGSP